MPVPTVYTTDSCFECELQAAGRCPTCRHNLCMDHFALESHDPCASRIAADVATSICYVCASPVVPQQWSTTTFTHYIDAHKCAGCGRFICAAIHTQAKDDVVKIVHEGMRGNRYHITVRYCEICAPMRRLGGIIGATWWAVGLATAACTAFFLFHR